MFELITDNARFLEVVQDMMGADEYAIDTEFHRERTYYPQVALVQLAWDDQVVLVDPLVVDLAPFARVLDGDGLCVMHAGSQDLEVLDLACQTIPRHLFDTQIGAGFLGQSSASLASLMSLYLNTKLEKGDRLTDWLARPLTDSQLTYAAGDVTDLLELATIIRDQLAEKGRSDWAAEESELSKTKSRNRRPPEDAILRIKEARSLKGQTYRVAMAVAEWRERRAASTDTPVRNVMPDIGVVSVAQKRPTTEGQIRKLRGIDGRHLRDGAAEEVLTAVRAGLRMPEDAPIPTPKNRDVPRELRPVLPLLTSWIAQLCRDNSLDPALVATRADIEGLLVGADECRLTRGWRAELVGEPISQLVSGRASVAFSDSKLVLESRSGQPVWFKQS